MYELTINLKSGDKTPLYEQLYEYIRGEIRDGHIASGEKLPSTRALSRHLEVSRSTVELLMNSCCLKDILKPGLIADIM